MRWFSPPDPRSTGGRHALDVLDDHTVADECQAFLAGAYVDARHADGCSAPIWSWMNEAAHADAAHLTALSTVPIDDVDVELRTRVLLARAVVSAARTQPLADLQRDVLVPLELTVMGTDPTPRRLIELVARALYWS